MEIRLWLPWTVSGWRYCLKHPKSFVIGFYGFKRWFAERQRALKLSGELQREQLAHELTRAKLARISRALSEMRRAA